MSDKNNASKPNNKPTPPQTSNRGSKNSQSDTVKYDTKGTLPPLKKINESKDNDSKK